MYGLAGERRLNESILSHLPGYERSVPVRIGNAAHAQRQLDFYGEVVAALHHARHAGIADRRHARVPLQQLHHHHRFRAACATDFGRRALAHRRGRAAPRLRALCA
jgi:hypothetical protein